jgi:hypothetical protein
MEQYSHIVERHAPSMESDRRHLLAPSAAPSMAPSLASSRPASVVSFASDCNDTESPSRHSPKNHRTQSKKSMNTPYKGFPSEAAYLKALLEFGKESEYFEPEDPLVGFYGSKTSADYMREYAEAKAERDKAKAKRRAEKDMAKKRKSIAKGVLPSVAEDDGGIEGDDEAVQPAGVRRMSKGFFGVFARRGTVA